MFSSLDAITFLRTLAIAERRSVRNLLKTNHFTVSFRNANKIGEPIRSRASGSNRVLPEGVYRVSYIGPRFFQPTGISPFSKQRGTF